MLIVRKTLTPVQKMSLTSSKVFLINTLENEGFSRLPNGQWIHEESERTFNTIMDAYLYYLEVVE